MIISMVAAIDQKNAIGRNNDIPWRIPSDFKWFKEYTMGKIIVMGYNTFMSLPGLLPGRPHFIFTTRTNISEIQKRVDAFKEKHGADKLPLVAICSGMEEFLRNIDSAFYDEKEICIVGGGQIYQLFMPFADRLVLTKVDAVIKDPDTFFPSIDSKWTVLEEVVKDKQDEKDQFAYSTIIYKRNDASVYLLNEKRRLSKIEKIALATGINLNVDLYDPSVA